MNESALGKMWRRLRSQPYAVAVFLLLSVAILVYMGNVKNYRDFVWDYDTRCWYTAGTCWLEGGSPYDRDFYAKTWAGLFGEAPRNKATFVYPPTMAIISLPVALFPWSVAPWLYRCANMVAVFGICFFTWKLMDGGRESRVLLGPSGWYFGLCALLASVSQCLTQGQCSLIVVCGCLAAWYGWRQKLWAVFLLGFLIACIKPQISMLPLVFILASGGSRWFVFGTLVSALFALCVLLLFPNTDILQGFQGSMENHLKYQEFNRWHQYSGVPALLGATSGGKAAAIAGVLLGLAATGWVGWRQRHTADTVRNQLRHAQLVWVVAFAAMPVHIYDLVGQVFVTATLWVIADWRVRALAFVTMFMADRNFTIANALVAAGGPLASLGHTLINVGTPLCGAILLVVFFANYWHENRSEPIYQVT